MKAIIVPGYQGHPNEHWLPRCAEMLEEIGVDAHVHDPKNSDEPVLEDQLVKLQNELDGIEGEKILIAHSLAVWLVLNMLLEVRSDIAGVILVSGAAGGLPVFDGLDDIDSAFYERTAEDFSSLREQYRFCMFNGTDDPIVPIEKARELAFTFCLEIHEIERGGHLNQDTLSDTEHDGPAKIDELLTGITDEVRAIMHVQ